MKKLLIGILVLLVFLTGSVYFFIPENITVAAEIVTGSSTGTVQRITGNSHYRLKWLPGGGETIPPSSYMLDGCTYQFSTDNSLINHIGIRYKNIQANSLLTLLPSGDTVLVNWLFSRQSSHNPVSRISDYFALRHIKQTNQKILGAMQAFLSSKKNVYGFEVNRENQTDSTLITIKATVSHYPTVTEIYFNIEKLKQYAAVNDAKATNAPMLNITAADAGNWSFMVALPINKALNNKGDIMAKRMFAGGKILITEPITGGFAVIDNALENLDKFRMDYNYLSPAIPFQSLITDRPAEPDSLKWKTKLYFPVY